MEKNLNKMKWCSVGRHSVTKLFHAQRDDRDSCCQYCYTSPPLKRTPLPKPQSKHLQHSVRVGETKKPAKSESLTRRNKAPVRELLKLAEVVFNKWVRHRDSEWGHFKCISCGEYLRIEDSDCGHFYPKTYSALRFDEDNCHSECVKCNRMDDNHLDGYSINLKEKIGLERFKSLQARRNEMKKWDREELLEIINKYKL